MSFSRTGRRQVGGAGQDALLVLQVALGHLDGRGCRRVEGRAGLQQANDLGAAVAGALHDLVELFLVVQPILTRSGSGMPATVE
jgi:hypothetical protein